MTSKLLAPQVGVSGCLSCRVRMIVPCKGWRKVVEAHGGNTAVVWDPHDARAPPRVRLHPYDEAELKPDWPALAPLFLGNLGRCGGLRP